MGWGGRNELPSLGDRARPHGIPTRSGPGVRRAGESRRSAGRSHYLVPRSARFGGQWTIRSTRSMPRASANCEFAVGRSLWTAVRREIMRRHQDSIDFDSASTPKDIRPVKGALRDVSRAKDLSSEDVARRIRAGLDKSDRRGRSGILVFSASTKTSIITRGNDGRADGPVDGGAPLA